MRVDGGLQGVDLGVQEFVARASSLHVARELVATKDPVKGDREPRKGRQRNHPGNSGRGGAHSEERVQHMSNPYEVKHGDAGNKERLREIHLCEAFTGLRGIQVLMVPNRRKRGSVHKGGGLPIDRRASF